MKVDSRHFIWGISSIFIVATIGFVGYFALQLLNSLRHMEDSLRASFNPGTETRGGSVSAEVCRLAPEIVQPSVNKSVKDKTPTIEGAIYLFFNGDNSFLNRISVPGCKILSADIMNSGLESFDVDPRVFRCRIIVSRNSPATQLPDTLKVFSVSNGFNVGYTVTVCPVKNVDYPPSMNYFSNNWVDHPADLGPPGRIPAKYPKAIDLRWLVMRCEDKHALDSVDFADFSPRPMVLDQFFQSDMHGYISVVGFAKEVDKKSVSCKVHYASGKEKRISHMESGRVSEGLNWRWSEPER